MSKAEYDYNMDQVILAMSDDIDWVCQSRYINKDEELVADYNQPLPLSGNKDLKKKKYALSITKRPTAEYKIVHIEEDIGILFRKTIAKYDEDVALGIHHWSKMQKLFYRGKRASVTKGNVYSNSRITFVKEVKVDHNFYYGFLDSIMMRVLQLARSFIIP
ncbi:hypothetical protein Tco_1164995 [Tanacetum coccineum]